MVEKPIKSPIVNDDNIYDIAREYELKHINFKYDKSKGVIYTVYWQTRGRGLQSKDFIDPTKAFRWWYNRPFNSDASIGTNKGHGWHFKAAGDNYHIIKEFTEFIEHAERRADW